MWLEPVPTYPMAMQLLHRHHLHEHILGLLLVIYYRAVACDVTEDPVNAAIHFREHRTSSDCSEENVIAYGLLIDRRDEMPTLELTYKVLATPWRISDRKVLDEAHDGENQRHGTELEFKTEAFHAILDETVKVDPRAKESNRKTSSTDVIYIDRIEKNGFCDKLRTGK